MRMRTLDAAHAAIVAADPETAITKTAVRRLALDGTIPTVMVGRKRLIDVDAALEILQGRTRAAPGQQTTEQQTHGIIRRIDKECRCV